MPERLRDAMPVGVRNRAGIHPARPATAPLVVTGAGGWIGAALMAEAHRRGRLVRPAARAPGGGIMLPDARGASVIHLAAIAHRKAGSLDEDQYLRINRDLAVDTARAARDAGATRFAFVSSAAVMGVDPARGPDGHPRPWTVADAPAPRDAYAVAKWQAEQALAALHAPGRFDVVVVRPPLVWGPGVRANFLQLLALAARGLPLPLADAVAPRSMVYLDNLVDALLHLADAPGAGGGTFFVRDDPDRSVAERVRAMRAAMGLPARLFHVPSGLLRRAAALVGRQGIHDRLFLPSRVDDAPLRATGWTPPVDEAEGLRRTVAWFRDARG